MSKYKTVAELLEDPARWTQGAYARDADCGTVPSTDTSACKWCVLGAIRVVYDHSLGQRWAAEERWLDAVGTKGYIEAADWNDNPARTHAEVLALVKAAGV